MHANKNFPALVVLDRYRQQLVRSLDQQSTFSNVFPRRVVLVRNLANENDMQWNGQPDIEQQRKQHDDASSASFEVIPNRLSVRCTSDCDLLLQNKLQRAFIVQIKSEKGNENGRRPRHEEHEIVVCSDRVLQSDYKKQPLQIDSSTDLPPRSLAAVEEVLAHALVVVEQQHANNNNNNKTSAASIQVQAAQAAECYYSRHEFQKHNHMQVKRGSQLGFTGFSLVPNSIQMWMQRQCIQRVATEQHLLVEESVTSRREAQKAVQEAMKQQQQQ